MSFINVKSTSNQLNCDSIFGFSFALFLFQLLFNLSDSYIKLASRLGLFGGIGFCILLPNFLSKALDPEIKKPFLWQFVVVVLSCLYFYFTTLRMNYLELMPYGVFGL